MSFSVVARDPKSFARAGIFQTPHGIVHTPAFMPVATKGTVKTIHVEELVQMGTEAIIANALHLHMRPGEDVLAHHGGLHTYMRWEGTLFTDSGGFQMIRKSFGIKTREEGITFRNFYNGTQEEFTPEYCLEVQKKIGSDVAMLLDECPVHDADEKSLQAAVDRTLRWAKRGIAHGRKLEIPNLFVITQGGVNADLRRYCGEELAKLNPEGFGIGGLSIGESKEAMAEVLNATTHTLPEDKPRYLMGVGSIDEIRTAVASGVDIFDSVFPTQCARHGTIFSSEGRYNLKGEKLNRDREPLDPNCNCPVCLKYTRGYINHLHRESEILGLHLTSLHNVFFVLDAVRKIRSEILHADSLKG